MSPPLPGTSCAPSKYRRAFPGSMASAERPTEPIQCGQEVWGYPTGRSVLEPPPGTRELKQSKTNGPKPYGLLGLLFKHIHEAMEKPLAFLGFLVLVLISGRIVGRRRSGLRRVA